VSGVSILRGTRKNSKKPVAPFLYGAVRRGAATIFGRAPPIVARKESHGKIGFLIYFHVFPGLLTIPELFPTFSPLV
jgi:hypothetical protein